MEESKLKALEALASTPLYYCNKCGYVGWVGPNHGIVDRCTYLAVDCHQDLRELTAELRQTNLQVDAMRKVVDIAREMIGKNITRPEVYKDRDTDKYKLALALAAITEKRICEVEVQGDDYSMRTSCGLPLPCPIHQS